mgnify:CR=1 FL=1
MADIEFNCPKCGKHLSVDGKGAGLDAPCPECGEKIRVPSVIAFNTVKNERPAGYSHNITLILVALILGGALVGSAYLLRQGAADLQQSIIMHGDSIKAGMGSMPAYPTGGEVRLGNVKLQPSILGASQVQEGDNYLKLRTN